MTILRSNWFAHDAEWTYEVPFAAVAEIKDHFAFFPDRVDEITLQPLS